MTTQFLDADIERDEGKRNYPYLDSRANWTIGVGRLMRLHPDLMARLPELKRTGVSDAQIMAWLDEDLQLAKAKLDLVMDWWRKLDDVRQDALVNMAFNLGVEKLSTWKHTDTDIMLGHWSAAAIDLEHDEPWASQVHDRAKRIAFQIDTGIRAWSVTQDEIDRVLAGGAPAEPPAPEPQPAEPPAQPAEEPPPTPMPGPAQPDFDPSDWKLDAESIGKQLLLTQVRHLMAGGGVATVLSALGMNADMVVKIIIILSGLLIFGLAGWWSAREKHQQRELVKAALSTPVPAQPVGALSDADIQRIAAALAAMKPGAAP